MKYTTTSGGVLTLPDHDPALAAFFARLATAAADESVTAGDFIALGYGLENPLMENKGGAAVVTAEVHASPWYHALADLLVRKEAQQRALAPLTVAQVAARLGYHESAVRQAIATGRLPATKGRGGMVVDAKDVAAFEAAARPRGPKAGPKVEPLPVTELAPWALEPGGATPCVTFQDALDSDRGDRRHCRGCGGSRQDHEGRVAAAKVVTRAAVRNAHRDTVADLAAAVAAVGEDGLRRWAHAVSRELCACTDPRATVCGCAGPCRCHAATTGKGRLSAVPRATVASTATSTALEAAIGSKPGVSFRLKGATLTNSAKVGARRTGTIAAGWTRLAVLAAGKAGQGATYWELEPAAGHAAVGWHGEGFYVHGAFRVAKQTRDEKEARDSFDAFKATP